MSRMWPSIAAATLEDWIDRQQQVAMVERIPVEEEDRRPGPALDEFDAPTPDGLERHPRADPVRLSRL